jgi:sirohydrochlorin ferrochelatase
VSRLLIAHGSPDPRHHETMQRLAEATQGVSGIATHVAYLDHDQPSVVNALASVAQEHDVAEPIDALGLFLSDGYHARVDVPEVLVAAARRVDITDHGTLGMGSWVLPALARGLSDAGIDVGDPRTGVVLMAAGSSRPEARDEVVELASTWQRERGGPVRAAFASGPGPTLDEALSMLTDAGCVKRSVALLMLAPGVLADRVIDGAQSLAVPVAEPLAGAPEVIDRIISLTAA